MSIARSGSSSLVIRTVENEAAAVGGAGGGWSGGRAAGGGCGGDVAPGGVAGGIDRADSIRPGCARGQAGVGEIGDIGADLGDEGEAAGAGSAENFIAGFVVGVVLP